MSILGLTREHSVVDIQIVIEVEVFEGWHCTECDEYHADVDENPLYECGECGDTFTREENGDNRCGTCNKFAAKIADRACPSCNGVLEESTDTVLDCPYCDGTDEIFNADDLADHIKEEHIN